MDKTLEKLHKEQTTVKIVGENSELIKKVIDILATEGIEADMVVESVDKQMYLTAKDELEMEAYLDHKLARLYPERNFLAGQYQFLYQQLAKLKLVLQKRPMDVPVMADIKKIEHDLEILSPAYELVNSALFKHIQDKYGNGRKLLYCKTGEDQPMMQASGK